METKFEISLEAYTSIVSENAKLKALLGRCGNLLVEMVSAQVKDWDINHLSPEECKEAQKMNDAWLIQKYSSESAVAIVMDNLPCFTVLQIKNAMAKSIRKELNIRLESLKMIDKFIGKTENAG